MGSNRVIALNQGCNGMFALIRFSDTFCFVVPNTSYSGYKSPRI